MIDNTKVYGFDAVAADTEQLIESIAKHDELFKLLRYTHRNPLDEKNLDAEEKVKFIEKGGITGVPRLRVSEENDVRNVVFIEHSSFTVNKTNPQYLDSVLTIDILCHVDNWQFYDRFKRLTYRPHAIAQIMKDMIDGGKFSGIGKAEFLAGDSLILTTNPDYAGITLHFRMINSRYE